MPSGRRVPERVERHLGPILMSTFLGKLLKDGIHGGAERACARVGFAVRLPEYRADDASRLGLDRTQDLDCPWSGVADRAISHGPIAALDRPKLNDAALDIDAIPFQVMEVAATRPLTDTVRFNVDCS